MIMYREQNDISLEKLNTEINDILVTNGKIRNNYYACIL